MFIRHPAGRIYIHEFRPFKPALLVKWNRAVKYGLARNSMIPDGRRDGRIIGRIQGVTSYPRNADNTGIPLHAGIHRPNYIIDVKRIHIFVYEKNMLQFAECGESK